MTHQGCKDVGLGAGWQQSLHGGVSNKPRDKLSVRVMLRWEL